MFGADGVHVEQRRLHHRVQCLPRQSEPWHLPGRAGMRLGNRQRILFGHSRRLLGQHHQRRLRGGRLFVVRRCCVHGYRSSVHGLHTLRRVRGGERVLVGTGQPELLGHADSLQSALRGRLRQPNRLYRQHAVAEGCAEYVSGTSPKLPVSKPTFTSLPRPFAPSLHTPLAPAPRAGISLSSPLRWIDYSQVVFYNSCY